MCFSLPRAFLFTSPQSQDLDIKVLRQSLGVMAGALAETAANPKVELNDFKGGIKNERRMFEFYENCKGTDLSRSSLLKTMTSTSKSSANPSSGAPAPSGGQAIVDTVVTHWDTFLRDYRHCTGGQELPPDTRLIILKYITTELANDLGLTDQGYIKTWIIIDDVRLFLRGMFSPETTQTAAINTVTTLERRLLTAAMFTYNLINSTRSGSVARSLAFHAIEDYDYLRVKNLSLIVTAAPDGSDNLLSIRFTTVNSKTTNSANMTVDLIQDPKGEHLVDPVLYWLVLGHLHGTLPETPLRDRLDPAFLGNDQFKIVPFNPAKGDDPVLKVSVNTIPRRTSNSRSVTLIACFGVRQPP